MRTSVALASLTGFLGALVALGCKCEEEKPYTPFEVASTLPGVPSSPSAVPSASAAVTQGENPALRRSMKAPTGARTWQPAGATLNAPKAQHFVQGLPFAPPDDPKQSVFIAWTEREPNQPMEPGGALWLYGDGEPRQLTALPGFVPTGPDCSLEADLYQSGPRTLTLDVGAHCGGRLVERSPTRAVLVLDPLQRNPVLQGFRVAAPAPGEILSLAIDSRDVDGDGRDDVTLRATGGASGPSGPTVSFIWLDRAAGRSRETNEPAGEFGRLVRKLETRAKAKKTAPDVLREAGDLRRSWSALCAESGTPRLFDLDGSPLTCNDGGQLSRALLAEVDAQLTLGHPFEALGALSRDGFYGGRLGDKDRSALDERVTRTLSIAASKTLGSFAVELDARPNEPHFSPLYFDGDRHLWVRTKSGSVVESSPPGTAPAPGALPAVGGAPPTAAAPASWPLRVEDPNGRIWTGAIPSCDRSEVMLGFVARDGRPVPPLPTSLLAPRPGSCKRWDAGPLSPAVPIAWHGVDLESFVAGTRLGVTATPGPTPGKPGSPLSNDGRSLVLPSALGPVVLEGSELTLWQGDAGRDISDCVVANGAELIACTQSGRVVVLSRGTVTAPRGAASSKADKTKPRP